MINFLFWNINKKPILNLVVQLIHEHNVDVLILAESNINDREVLIQLNSSLKIVFYPDIPIPKRLQILTRYPSKFVTPISDSPYISFRHFQLPLYGPILLGAIHLPSKRYHSESEQVIDCTVYTSEIKRAENSVGHTRTIVVGDFNMNPFEQGIVAAAGFHAISDKEITKRGYRHVGDQDYKFFYNPMWSHFGDKRGFAGTYYYDKGTQINYYWHIFDQILVRPELLEEFIIDKLKILSQVGSISLLNSYGKPDSSVGSDHLPLLFSMEPVRRI
ncbi:hypothetical protein ES703_106178 [subsurface metagenome]